MNILVKSLLMVCFVGLVSGLCERLDEQWSGAISEALMDQKECFLWTAQGAIFVDYYIQMTRVDLTVYQENSQVDIRVFQDFKAHKQYTYILDSGSCQVLPLNSSEKLDPVIPSDAKFLGHFLIGTQEIESFYLERPDFGISEVAQFTSQTCFPVNVQVLNKTSDGMVTIFENYYDVVPIVPPHVFDLPSACKQSSPSFALDERFLKRLQFPLPTRAFLL
eukprot:CAMPEP_0174253396 /NCGR_PEP_ID=MMETSP0439-20130205/2762_1 /TAXON_ID=0 /ORGANISM="Stereomyxa ramosa, Strain Chinc5" /LENGTH=219 /DNA_ID=CAMNT_0015334397 /DNA_START=85 /DNA_END=744 /DNA_ORIENTATION=-